MSYIGIDPGQTGAAVLVGADGLEVLDIECWRGSRIPPRIRMVEPSSIVSLEAQYGSRPTTLVLAEWCGRLLATLPEGCTVHRPLATTWRGRVLRRSRLRRDVAKELAIRAARPHLEAAGWTHITDDVAEAWCMARYSWGADRAGVLP